jgi:hypothetical protein
MFLLCPAKPTNERIQSDTCINYVERGGGRRSQYADKAERLCGILDKILWNLLFPVGSDRWFSPKAIQDENEHESNEFNGLLFRFSVSFLLLPL